MLGDEVDLHRLMVAQQGHIRIASATSMVHVTSAIGIHRCLRASPAAERGVVASAGSVERHRVGVGSRWLKLTQRRQTNACVLAVGEREGLGSSTWPASWLTNQAI